ncbi:MAG: hypothetical protein ACYDH0_08085 [Candidatus Aminicenantales bacterium]
MANSAAPDGSGRTIAVAEMTDSRNRPVRNSAGVDPKVKKEDGEGQEFED